jgi:hypothetical protein
VNMAARCLRAVAREVRSIAATAAFVETGLWCGPVMSVPQAASAPDLLDRVPSGRPLSEVERELWRQLSDLTVPGGGSS